MNIVEQKARRYSVWRFGGNREAVIARDFGRCVQCGTTEQTVVHHKKGLGHNNLEDLELLCRRCHAAFHKEERRLKKLSPA